MIRLSKQGRGRVSRRLKNEDRLGDLFILRRADRSYSVELKAWDTDLEVIVPVIWDFPRETPLARVEGARDVLILALEGNVFQRSAAGIEPIHEHGSSIIADPDALVKLHREVQSAVYEKNSRDAQPVGGAA